eukprot:g56407.t1
MRGNDRETRRNGSHIHNRSLHCLTQGEDLSDILFGFPSFCQAFAPSVEQHLISPKKSTNRKAKTAKLSRYFPEITTVTFWPPTSYALNTAKVGSCPKNRNRNPNQGLHSVLL